ncbi:MAG: hypothetical protein HZA32_12670 [Opitutae bacterium]|nr:hypothetical protein [Opitutae bacterium]
MRWIFLLCALTATVSAADFRPVLLEHAKRYPQLEPQDCYKLLFQAVLGAEHAVADEAGARKWMENELASLGDGPDEPLVDPIAPDGALARVHLRPFVARGGDAAKLVRAFVATAQRKFGTRDQLAEAWNQVVTLAEEKRLPFTAAAAREFGDKMRTAGWPAVHHSKAFGAAHRPAYRVIAWELLSGVVPPER